MNHIANVRPTQANLNNIALKLDLITTFDTIEWPYFHKTPIKLQFSTIVITLIIHCLSSAEISIRLITQEPLILTLQEDFFKKILSPYTFPYLCCGVFCNYEKYC